MENPEQYNQYQVARQNGAYEMLKKALGEMQPDDLVEMVKASGLRGRGGAGAPTGHEVGLHAERADAHPAQLPHLQRGRERAGTFNNREIWSETRTS